MFRHQIVTRLPLFTTLLLLSLATLNCAGDNGTPTVPVPQGTMPPIEAMTLALECPGTVTSNRLGYAAQEAEPAGYASAQEALDQYELPEALPNGVVAFMTASESMVVWVYEDQDDRVVGKVAASRAADRSWVLTEIVRCAP